MCYAMREHCVVQNCVDCMHFKNIAVNFGILINYRDTVIHWSLVSRIQYIRCTTVTPSWNYFHSCVVYTNYTLWAWEITNILGRYWLVVWH